MTTAVSRDEVRAAFETYRRTRERRVRNWLIEAHGGLAVHTARRFAHRGEPLDDLVQVATLGLLKAVERFDPQRGTEFSTYAIATMVGELKRHFRDHTWTVHVPWRAQVLHQRMRAAVDELTQRLGRAPSVAEVAEHMGATEEEVLEGMEAADAYRSTPLDGQGDESLVRLLGRRLGVEDNGYELAEQRMIIARALGAMPSREAEIIRMRYYEEMTQSEIAGQIGISQMHVSRLLTKTLERLRVQLLAGDPERALPAAAVRCPPVADVPALPSVPVEPEPTLAEGSIA